MPTRPITAAPMPLPITPYHHSGRPLPVPPLGCRHLFPSPHHHPRWRPVPPNHAHSDRRDISHCPISGAVWAHPSQGSGPPAPLTNGLRHAINGGWGWSGYGPRGGRAARAARQRPHHRAPGASFDLTLTLTLTLTCPPEAPPYGPEGFF